MPVSCGSVVVGLVSDTHAVWDPDLEQAFADVSLILHAGDLGHHGAHEEVLKRLQEIAPTTAVRGNVDDTASLKELPESAVLDVNGWRILMTHIVGMPPKVVAEAQALIADIRPDIVVFGHSHAYSEMHNCGVWYINPGSAGPARFKLPRTVALMRLPPRDPEGGESGDAQPSLQRVELAPKAPPRLRSSGRPECGGSVLQKSHAQKRVAQVKHAAAANMARTKRTR